jgi:hemerythrin
MSYIKWSEEYNINIPKIDSQHRRLIDLINELTQAKTEKKDAQIHGKILTELVEYTQIHFKEEEDFMNEIEYPNTKDHEALHKLLINQVIEVLQNYKQGYTDITDKVLYILNSWLIKHILKEDQAISKYYNK